MRLAKRVVTSIAVGAAFAASPALAQTTDVATLMAMDNSGLVGELDRRYQDGLSASLDQAVVAANNSRYLWALETKVQCGIALGFMKSSHRDPTSIGNCARAHAMMNRAPAAPPRAIAPPPRAIIPPPPPPSPSRRAPFCEDARDTTVFFDFDSSELKPGSMVTLDTVAQQARDCGWVSLAVVGHADQAGSDAYNLALSRRRADVVAGVLRGKFAQGIAVNVDAKGEANPRVPLADGTPSPENRRVEISAQ